MPSWHLILYFQPSKLIKNCVFLASDSLLPAIKFHQELCFLGIWLFSYVYKRSSRTVSFWYRVFPLHSSSIIKNCAFIAPDSFAKVITFHQQLCLPSSDSYVDAVKYNQEPCLPSSDSSIYVG